MAGRGPAGPGPGRPRFRAATGHPCHGQPGRCRSARFPAVSRPPGDGEAGARSSEVTSLRLGDVRAAGVNWTRRISQSGASARRDSIRAPVCCQWAQNSTLGPGAGDAGAHRAEVGGALEQLHRARVERGAAGLVDPVGQAAADQGEVVARETQDEQRRRAPRCATASAIGTSAGIAARASTVGTGCGRDGQQALQAGRRVEPGHALGVADHEPAEQRGGRVVRVALQLAGELEHAARRARTCGRRRPGRPRWPQRSSPGRRPRGISERIWKVRPSAGRNASKACTQRLVRSQGTPGVSQWTKNSPVSSTSSSRERSSAAASTS